MVTDSTGDGALSANDGARADPDQVKSVDPQSSEPQSGQPQTDKSQTDRAQSDNALPNQQVTALYAHVGGMDFFVHLVDEFYRGVETDPRLRPMYPDDLTESRHHLALFLAQYYGGPRTYSDARGHPRLRMRHAPFVIGPTERDAWLEHILAALDQMTVGGKPLSPVLRLELIGYFTMAANSIVNVG